MYKRQLHSCRYGKNQTRLISLIESLKIDAVLFAGDIIDDKLPEGRAYKLIQTLEAKMPCFYVAGNHEYRTRKADEIKRRLKSMGVTVLQGGCADVVLNGQRVLIFGVDDPEFGQNAFETQLGGLKGKDDVYSVLLAHRPEYIDKYLEHNFDLILSGHAHGGQWRLPGLINGLYAPNPVSYTHLDVYKRQILGAGGLISGLLNGLLGTGGGILAIPAFRMAGEQQRHAQANASVFMLFMSIISAAVLLFSGERVDWASALPVAAAGIPGAAAGALLLNKLSNRVLQLIFSLLILASGIRILF